MQASHPAALAFRSLCNRCSAKLRRPATLLALIEAAEAVLASPAQPSKGAQAAPSPTAAVASDDRVVIVEGLARIVAVLPPADAAAAGLRLATPFIHGVQQTATATAGKQVTSSTVAQEPAPAPCLNYHMQTSTLTDEDSLCVEAGGHVSDEAAAAAASDLQLLAASIRFLEFSSAPAVDGRGHPAEAHPALHIMQQAYPVLAALLEAPAWRAQADVVDAACEVYRRTLLSVKVRSPRSRLPLIRTSTCTLRRWAAREHDRVRSSVHLTAPMIW